MLGHALANWPITSYSARAAEQDGHTANTLDGARALQRRPVPVHVNTSATGACGSARGSARSRTWCARNLFVWPLVYYTQIKDQFNKKSGANTNVASVVSVGGASAASAAGNYSILMRVHCSPWAQHRQRQRQQQKRIRAIITLHYMLVGLSGSPGAPIYGARGNVHACAVPCDA